MAATATVQELNGAGPTATDITTARYCTDDNNNPGTNYPIPVPAAGSNYSYWKHHRLKFTGTYTQITNVKFYCDGTINWGLGSAGEVRVGMRDSGDCGCPVGNYQQATGGGHTQGTTGAPIEDDTNGHAYYNGQTNETDPMTGKVSGSPLVVDTTTISGDPNYSKSVVSQVKVDSDATQGVKSAETLTFIYDEI